MKSELGTPVVAVVILVVVCALAFWGYKAMQPAYYKPSPGVGGTPAVGSPGYGPPGGAARTNASGTTKSGRPYEVPPVGAIPGKPGDQPGAPGGAPQSR